MEIKPKDKGAAALKKADEKYLAELEKMEKADPEEKGHIESTGHEGFLVPTGGFAKMLGNAAKQGLIFAAKEESDDLIKKIAQSKTKEEAQDALAERAIEYYQSKPNQAEKDSLDEAVRAFVKKWGSPTAGIKGQDDVLAAPEKGGKIIFDDMAQETAKNVDDAISPDVWNKVIKALFRGE